MNEMGTPYNWAIEAIRQERVRQEKKWGRQLHENRTWLTIALEEFGEIAKAMLERGEVRKEAIQTAAVLVAWLEDSFERGEFPVEMTSDFNDTAISVENQAKMRIKPAPPKEAGEE